MRRTWYTTDQVTYMSDRLGLHSVGNPSTDPEDFAISLHLYTVSIRSRVSHTPPTFHVVVTMARVDLAEHIPNSLCQSTPSPHPRFTDPSQPHALDCAFDLASDKKLATKCRVLRLSHV